MDADTIAGWFKLLWPAFVLIGGFAFRLEVGQSLNKQRMKNIEANIARVEVDNERNISRIEKKIDDGFSEVRTDIKALIAKG